MRYLTLILLSTLLFTSLYADEFSKHILITKTSKKSNLKLIKSRLNSLNIKMFVKKSNAKYLVYSGKYRSKKSARYALKKIKRYFPSALIIENQRKTKTPEPTAETSNIFIAGALGFANINESSSYGYENGGISYALEAGYIFNKNIFISLGYLNSSTSDIKMHSIYTSANYKINFTKNLGLYIGIIGGYGTLELSGYEQSSASCSILAGVQVGTSYSIYEDIDIYLAYQGISLDHVINMDNSSSIEFDFLHNLQLGIQYKF